ncbi:type II secretion system protein GspL [Massilia agilis]|uniref:Type II secretion system protein GspL n=1 Tax=Massilia agilis TaxID=1811226 RepID=A0ABT2DD16_9BURK|nr:type II secretion system protein GspL [Massilia agilis]MCS0809218.1 type II secretion system protein GspL [Massilia agilis]
MTTLYIRHPARAEGEGALCSFAVVGDAGAIEQAGVGALRNLGDLVAAARRVTLIISAADVTLLSVQAPPLSGARLKAALPGLVEEHVLGDPLEAVLVAGPQQPDNTRPVAVVQRDWLEPLVRTLLAQGARTVSAVPAQLCLPLLPGSVTAVIGAGELTLRQSQYQGLGLALDGNPAMALQTARALGGDAPLVLYVPSEQLGEYQALAAEASPGVSVEADDWAHWISGSKSTAFDLVPGLGAAGAPQRDWRRWRWPTRLGLLILIINLAALNIQWLRLRGEANAIRQSMTQTFRAAYPNQPVIDPVAQMRQNITRAKASSGELAHDEFNYLAAALGEAVRGLGRQPGISSIEYRERALTVKVKAETVDPSLTSQLKTALATRGISLEETAPATWRVASTGARQ